MEKFVNVQALGTVLVLLVLLYALYYFTQPAMPKPPVAATPAT
jgi:hypothetical protein